MQQMICEQTADSFEGDLQSSKEIIFGRIFRICRYLIADPPQPWKPFTQPAAPDCNTLSLVHIMLCSDQILNSDPPYCSLLHPLKKSTSNRLKLLRTILKDRKSMKASSGPAQTSQKLYQTSAFQMDIQADTYL